MPNITDYIVYIWLIPVVLRYNFLPVTKKNITM